METCRVGTLALSTSRATWSVYVAAGFSGSENLMAHGDEPLAVFFSSVAEVILTGCTANQFLEGSLWPITNLTGFSGDPPANSFEERSNVPILQTTPLCPSWPAFAGRQGQAAAKSANTRIELLHALTESPVWALDTMAEFGGHPCLAYRSL